MDKRVQSYMGHDPGNGSDIVIDQAPPAARNGSIEYYDFGEGKSHKVRVMDIRRHRRGLALLVAVNDSGESRVLELLA